MPFSFTFKLAVPGLSNPFLPTQSLPSAQVEPPNVGPLWVPRDKVARRHLTSEIDLPPSAPLSRKRGWVPSSPEPSQSAATFTSTSGYLDTPAKYREMAAAGGHSEREAEMSGELPPAKRRRTLAGSIVSTALSAALIGTAVGLTVYRLWRDRGKEPEQISAPPPPYQQGEWVPTQQKQIIQVTPPTPRGRKTRHPPASVRKPIHHRRPRIRPHTYTPPRSTSPSRNHHQTPIQPEFDFGQPNDEEAEVEDQMDWIGDKLTMLIEEGKKALGREVVVMSDAREDEVDDGTGAWEEVDAGPSSSRRGSLRHSKRPRSIAPPLPLYSSPLPSASPRTGQFHSPQPNAFASLPVTPKRIPSVDPDVYDDERTWESPELRESMERARARFLRNRGT